MDNTDEIEKLFNTMTQFHKLMIYHTQESQEDKAATILQFSALNYINESDKGTVTKLSDSLKLSKSSATQLVERLVVAGFVERISDMHDKRITRLLITDKGRQEIKNIKNHILGKMKIIFAKLPKKDILELIRIHTTMIASLEKNI